MTNKIASFTLDASAPSGSSAFIGMVDQILSKLFDSYKNEKSALKQIDRLGTGDKMYSNESAVANSFSYSFNTDKYGGGHRVKRVVPR